MQGLAFPLPGNIKNLDGEKKRDLGEIWQFMNDFYLQIQSIHQ
jgi:hypothetical protein